MLEKQFLLLHYFGYDVRFMTMDLDNAKDSNGNFITQSATKAIFVARPSIIEKKSKSLSIKYLHI